MVDPLLSGNESQEDILNLNTKRGYLLKYSKHYRHEQILDANEKESIFQKSILEDSLKESPNKNLINGDEVAMAQRNTLPYPKKKKALHLDELKKRTRRVSFMESSDSEAYYHTVKFPARDQKRWKPKPLDFKIEKEEILEPLKVKVEEQRQSTSSESRSPASSPEALQGADYFSLYTPDQQSPLEAKNGCDYFSFPTSNHDLDITLERLNIDGDAVLRFGERKRRRRIARNGIPQWLSKMFLRDKKIEDEEEKEREIK